MRLVLLLQVFYSENVQPPPQLPLLTPHLPPDIPPSDYVEKCAAKIEDIGLGPVTRADLVEVLCSKFAPDRFKGILEYGSKQMRMSEQDVEELVLEVALRCLEIGCKGRMLERLDLAYPFLRDAIRVQVMKCYRLDVADLPPAEDAAACVMFEVPLCQDFVMPRVTLTERLAELTHRSPGTGAVPAPEPAADSASAAGDAREDANTSAGASTRDGGDDDDLVRATGVDKAGVGFPRADALAGSRWPGHALCDDPQGRAGPLARQAKVLRPVRDLPRHDRQAHVPARWVPTLIGCGDVSHCCRLDHTPVGRWVRGCYGPLSAVTAIFMIHAVVNLNPMVRRISTLCAQIVIRYNL